MCESGWSDGESFRTSRQPLSASLSSEVEHISMVTDHGELLFCCSPSLRARRRCASGLRGGISSANVTVAAQQTQQLCLIALTFKVKQTADLHFDHSGLIYEFISVVWQVKYYMCCNQSRLPLCLCTKIHLHFHLSRLKLILWRSSRQSKPNPAALRDRHRHVSSQFIGGECFLLPFNILHCSRSLACQCRLSNKLMVCLITLWDIWGRTEGGPPQRRLWALNKMDRTNRYRSAERNVLYGYAPWMNYFFYTTQGMSWFESIN